MDEKNNNQTGEQTVMPQIAEMSSEIEISDTAYRVKLAQFEGPLDLLLHFVKRAKIDIQDIFVSEITEQYLDHMDQVDELELEVATEFLETAAQLLEIKTRSLLPKPEVELPDEEDPKKQLIRRLEEYKLYKEACEKLKEQETVGIHYRQPDQSVGEPRFVLKDMTMEGLMRALQKMFLKLEKRVITKVERHITLDRFTVAEKMSHIKDFMLMRDTATFDELFDEDYSKSEIITTFQALLELLKVQFMTAEQHEIFGEIKLRKVQ